MWSAVRLVAVMPVVSAMTTLPLPSMPPTCCTAPSNTRMPAAAVLMLLMLARCTLVFASIKAETEPASSRLALLATVTVTPAPTTGVMPAARFKFSVPPLTFTALPMLSVVGPVSVSLLVLVLARVNVDPAVLMPSVRLPSKF